MGHYDSCRTDWKKESSDCKSDKAKNGKHDFKESGHGVLVCQNKECKKIVYVT